MYALSPGLHSDRRYDAIKVAYDRWFNYIKACHYWVVWKETCKTESDPRNMDHTRTGSTLLAWQKYRRDRPLAPIRSSSCIRPYMANWKVPIPNFLLHPINQAWIYNMVSVGAYTAGPKTKFLGMTLR